MIPTMRQLEALVLVYRLGSITKAAAELRVTQSAISLLIRQMEDNFQLKLFDRTTRALHPTPACKDAIPVAERDPRLRARTLAPHARPRRGQDRPHRGRGLRRRRLGTASAGARALPVMPS